MTFSTIQGMAWIRTLEVERGVRDDLGFDHDSAVLPWSRHTGRVLHP